MILKFNRKIQKTPVIDYASGQKLSDGADVLMDPETLQFVLSVKIAGGLRFRIFHPDDIRSMNDDRVLVDISGKPEVLDFPDRKYVVFFNSTARVRESLPLLILSEIMVDSDTMQITDVGFAFDPDEAAEYCSRQRAEEAASAAPLEPVFAPEASSAELPEISSEEDPEASAPVQSAAMERIDALDSRFSKLEAMLETLISKQSAAQTAPEPAPVSDPLPKFEPEPASDPLPKFEPEPASDPLPEFEPEPASDPIPKFAPEQAASPVRESLPKSSVRSVYHPVFGADEPEPVSAAPVITEKSPVFGPDSASIPVFGEESEIPPFDVFAERSAMKKNNDASPEEQHTAISRRGSLLIPQDSSALSNCPSQLLAFLLFTGSYVALSHFGIL